MEALNDHQRAIFHAALDQHRASVLPQRVRMKQTLTVDADAVPAGKTVRAWIPYPQAIPGQQEDIRYVASVPSKHHNAPDRKSVVEGKSVSVRVDLGGRRNIKKTTNTITITTKKIKQL